MLLIPTTIKEIAKSDARMINNLPDFYFLASEIAAGKVPEQVIVEDRLIKLFSLNEIPAQVILEDGMGNEVMLGFDTFGTSLEKVDIKDIHEQETDSKDTSMEESGDL